METPGHHFTDLAEFRRAHVPSRTRGNIIKSSHVTIGAAQQIGVPVAGPDEPVILLHREGDRVTSAEFICKCGRSATLRLEYEQE